MPSLDHLLGLGLAWQAVGGLRALTGVADALGTGPGSSGLRPRSPEAAKPTAVRKRIGELSPPALAMLRARRRPRR